MMFHVSNRFVGFFFSLVLVSASFAKCPPLESRLTMTEVALEAPISSAGLIDSPANFGETAGWQGAVISPSENGEVKVAWTEKGKSVVHVTPLDKNLKRKSGDWTIPNVSLRDMVAHDDGSAILYHSGSRMGLMRLHDESGKVLFDNRHLGSYISSRMHMGSLGWDGTRYATYYAVHNAGHEGDALSLIDATGKRERAVWDWGCSHSIDQRMIFHRGSYQALCLTEAFPGYGLYLNHSRAKLADIPGNRKGATDGRIGGWASVGEHLAVAYNRRHGSGWQGYLTVGKHDEAGRFEKVTLGLIPNESAHESNLKIARFGKNKMVVSWDEPANDNRTFRVLSENAQVALDQIEVPAFIYPRSDFKTLPNGDVVWISLYEDPMKLGISRLAHCE